MRLNRVAVGAAVVVLVAVALVRVVTAGSDSKSPAETALATGAGNGGTTTTVDPGSTLSGPITTSPDATSDGSSGSPAAGSTAGSTAGSASVSPPGSTPRSTGGTTATPPLTAAAPPPGGLAVKVAGNRLVDGAGRPLTLRGVNMSGTEFVCAQNWSDDPYGGQPMAAASTMNAIASWQANVLRVPLNEDCWLDVNGVQVGGAPYHQAIRDEVTAAHAAGLYVVLDLHWTAPGTQRALSQNPLPDTDHSLLFWQQVATSFKNDPGVIFDLFNEPYHFWGTGDPWDDWRNGGTHTQYVTGGQPYTISANWRTAGMQQLVDTVRSTGATQPILVNGLDWANDVSGWLDHAPTDPLHQIIAGAHIYNGQPCSDAGCWNRVYPAIQASYPVLIGETGDSSGGPATFLPSFLSYAEAHGWNYLGWTWNVWSDENNVLITAWTGTPNAGAGTTFRNHLMSVR